MEEVPQLSEDNYKDFVSGTSYYSFLLSLVFSLFLEALEIVPPFNKYELFLLIVPSRKLQKGISIDSF